MRGHPAARQAEDFDEVPASARAWLPPVPSRPLTARTAVAARPTLAAVPPASRIRHRRRSRTRANAHRRGQTAARNSPGTEGGSRGTPARRAASAGQALKALHVLGRRVRPACSERAGRISTDLQVHPFPAAPTPSALDLFDHDRTDDDTVRCQTAPGERPAQQHTIPERRIDKCLRHLFCIHCE